VVNPTKRMKYLIISDLHSNIEALTAVLGSIKRKKMDRVLVLGDLVGYGASPNQVVDTIRKTKNAIVIRGNHDKVASGIENGENFNRAALQSAQWTQKKLTADNRSYLNHLPQGPVLVDGSILVAHGTPLDEDAYLFSDYDAYEVFQVMDFNLCFFGHTHLPVIYAVSNQRLYTFRPNGERVRIELMQGFKYLINPGSVGQPRDKNPLASFAIYDSDHRSITFKRISYSIPRSQEKILRAGLPQSLANRLAIGV
jgi:predicted phosphodiesterase